jgi:hypothetical protein|tara:strand:+ start:379 stop:1023 length:645 start_codon:yes stop_codon:yes gene_type:complete
MKIKNYSKLTLSNPELNAYMTKFNILQNKDIIFPHEETINENHITNEIIKNSVIVFGVTFELHEDVVSFKDEIFILDGHHRVKYIKDNLIDELFEVVFIDIHSVNIESYNSELRSDQDIFIKKIMDDKDFSKTNLGSFFIEINNIKYFSKKIKNIYELYSYKKELLDDGVISPIKNNENTDKPIVNFTAISSENFNKDIIFPYKSTWITPRFDV